MAQERKPIWTDDDLRVIRSAYDKMEDFKQTYNTALLNGKLMDYSELGKIYGEYSKLSAAMNAKLHKTYKEGQIAQTEFGKFTEAYKHLPASEALLARSAPFYDKMDAQGVFLPEYAPPPALGYNYDMALSPYTSGFSEYAMVLPLFLVICFLFMAIACFTLVCCGTAGIVFGRRSSSQDGQNERKEHAYEVM